MNFKTISTYFTLFREIDIINQLSRTAINAQLPEGLASAHFNVLNHLSRFGDGDTPLQLTRAFQVPKTTMTHTLAGLLKHELVDIRPDPRDGRGKQIWISKKGHMVREEAIAKIAPTMVETLKDIPVEDLEVVVGKLAEIRKILDENRN